MAGSIEGVDRQQATLFLERLGELVAGDVLVRVIDRFVEQLDVWAAGLFGPIARYWAGRDQDAHGMLAPLFGTTTATRSVGPARRSFASP